MKFDSGKRLRALLYVLLGLCILMFLISSWLSKYGVIESPRLPPQPPITSIAPDDANVRVLMFGNSHTAMHGLPKMLAEMLEEATPNKRYYLDRSPNMDFLTGKWESTQVQKLFHSQKWDVLILQGQKYSVSGLREYPTAAAKNWIQAAHKRNIRPILYPEWGQRGNLDEGRRVHALHHAIAEKSNAEVAPVGMAWEVYLDQLPEAELHAHDGNHASAAGAYLTACVLVATITNKSPVGLSAPDSIDAETAARMQTTAWKAFNEHPPR